MNRKKIDPPEKLENVMISTRKIMYGKELLKYSLSVWRIVSSYIFKKMEAFKVVVFGTSK